MTAAHSCRLCSAPLTHVVVDLGMSPLSNGLIDPSEDDASQPAFPLRLYACDRCWLVQLPAHEAPDAIFREYAYFSSYSTTWLAHARAYAEAIVERLQLDRGSLVVELASNDGYLLREFQARAIPVLGIEPARNVARAAQEAGVPTLTEFFGTTLARELAASGRVADLIVANNVLAHVPDLNDFVAGIALALGPGGSATLEFPHVLRMLQRAEFDTIYHEHYSYFSLHAAQRAFERHGLEVVDVEELSTHGGSLRVYVQHQGAGAISDAVAKVLSDETAAGLERLDGYATLGADATRVKRDLLAFLTQVKGDGASVAGYGAPAKATTLLNYCGIGTDLLPYTVDRSPHKQGRHIPGVRVPIHAPERIFETKPDYVLVLPWNLKDEIVDQMADIRKWGGRFVVPIPSLAIVTTR